MDEELLKKFQELPEYVAVGHKDHIKRYLHKMPVRQTPREMRVNDSSAVAQVVQRHVDPPDLATGGPYLPVRECEAGIESISGRPRRHCESPIVVELPAVNRRKPLMPPERALNPNSVHVLQWRNLRSPRRSPRATGPRSARGMMATARLATRTS
mmetsp:Transcript_24277/g.44573  ORF Transcript_24277/g.44573 Transcript_24277/m.44573 type:complete len:155 (-) Transcript_24277:77-541(-)